MGKKQLGKAERNLIWHYHRLGYGMREIARYIGYNHSTVLRELKRNDNQCDTWQEASEEAQRLSTLRKQKANSHPKITKAMTDAFCKDLKTKRITPELFAGERKQAGEDTVCKDSYYRWLYKERRYLIKYLPKQGRKFTSKRRKVRKLPESPIPKKNISQRPKEADERILLGHLEGDTMHGKKGTSVLSVHLDKTSKYTFLKKLSTTSSLEFKEATIVAIANLPEHCRHSLTLDNGPEMALFYEINKHIQTYFCNPYHSWEKGSVENRIQVVRLFIPKGFDIDLLTDEQIQAIEDTVNNRPMKILNYKTPKQVFDQLIKQNLAA